MLDTTMGKLSWRDRMDVARQLARYNKECGEVIVVRVDPAIFIQQPIAAVHARLTEMIEEKRARRVGVIRVAKS